MKRIHYLIEKATIDGGQSFELVEPGYDDKQAAKKGARDLEPGVYWMVAFDSPEPVAVEPPPAAVRNVAKFGRTFVERKGNPKPKAPAKAKK